MKSMFNAEKSTRKTPLTKQHLRSDSLPATIFQRVS
jgi:hypothetical protein